MLCRHKLKGIVGEVPEVRPWRGSLAKPPLQGGVVAVEVVVASFTWPDGDFFHALAGHPPLRHLELIFVYKAFQTSEQHCERLI